jgi:hypothetical protein
MVIESVRPTEMGRTTDSLFHVTPLFRSLETQLFALNLNLEFGQYESGGSRKEKSFNLVLAPSLLNRQVISFRIINYQDNSPSRSLFRGIPKINNDRIPGTRVVNVT